MKKTGSLLFSVVVCTYNRAELLKTCLDSLIKQSLSKSAFEIIVMDDGSGDNTNLLLMDYQKKISKPEIRIFKSLNVGLGKSRNDAIDKAKGQFIAYIDDDACADKDWLKNAGKCLREIKPRPEGITGPVYPYYINRKPDWFKNSYEWDLKSGGSRFLKVKETFSGPNMILDKKLIRKYGKFSETISMKGEVLMPGEETIMFERFWRQNPQARLLYYSTQVKVFHLVHRYKMFVTYRLKRWFTSGQSYYSRNITPSFLKNLLICCKVVGYLFYSLILSVITLLTYRRIQNWIVERIGPVFFVAGFFTVYFRLPLKIKIKDRNTA